MITWFCYKGVTVMDMNLKNSKKIVALFIIVLIALIVALNSITIVDPGHTGVVVTLGKVKEGTLQEGIHIKAPFVQVVKKIDNRIVKLEVQTEAFSKDLQTVDTKIAVNYRVDTKKSYSIYKNVGTDYEEVLVVPAVNEVLKAAAAKYTAEESVVNREAISDDLIVGLNNKLNDAGLFVTDINIVNYDFSEAFIAAIEDKQVAQQKLLKAETEKQTEITNAQAKAEATKIEAEGTAEANRVLNDSLSDRVLENKKLEKWNGELPQVTGDGSTIIDLK